MLILIKAMCLKVNISAIQTKAVYLPCQWRIKFSNLNYIEEKRALN